MGKIKLERLFLSGPVGRLEGLLEFDVDAVPAAAAVVCHPHPLFGGTMHNRVVYRAAKAALQAGLPALRFNFRGVEKSEGEFAEGPGERDDARAAVDYLSGRFPDIPIVMMGFSFGAWVGLTAGTADPRVRALVGLGLPTGSADWTPLRGAAKPLLIVQGTGDIFGPRDEIEALFSTLPQPKRLHWVEGVDHFFGNRLEEIRVAVRAFLQETFPGRGPK
ncbi:MAG: alpha/beta hydrolase [Terriglobia bacterium]